MVTTESPRTTRWLTPAALAAVYVIWGSTYLGLKYMVTGFPPLIGNGVRFSVAGLLVLAFARRRSPLPTARQWWGAAQVGVLLLMGGVGLVTIAESLGVGSALAATAAAAVPLWTALWSGLFGRWPAPIEWAGMGLGIAGVVVLSGEGDFDGNTVGVVLLVVAPVLWALGSVWNGRVQQPAGAMASAAQMLAAAPVLVAAGVLRGERFEGPPGLTAWLAVLYLAVFGSAIAFAAYVYLLQNVRPALATSYAYVNPVVALILGVTIGGEVLSGHALIALPLILGGVALVLGYRSRSQPS